MTRITPSEDWPGFTFEFSNGWSVSIQQGGPHYCTTGKTAEVAIFDEKENWYGYDDEKRNIFIPDKEYHDTYVNGHLNADDIAKIISIISQEKVDIQTSK